MDFKFAIRLSKSVSGITHPTFESFVDLQDLFVFISIKKGDFDVKNLTEKEAIRETTPQNSRGEPQSSKT